MATLRLVRYWTHSDIKAKFFFYPSDTFSLSRKPDHRKTARILEASGCGSMVSPEEEEALTQLRQAFRG